MSILDKKSLTGTLKSLTTILLISVGASYCANFFWLADLFSHFLLQYIIGASFLGLLAITLKLRIYFIINICLLFLCLAEMTFIPSTQIKETREISEISIVQFNKLVSNTNYPEIKSWIKKQEHLFDFIVFQEADSALVELSIDLKNIYPYQIHEPRNHAFGTVILSRYDFLETEKIEIEGPVFTNFATKTTIHPSNFKDEISIFSLHAVPPTSHEFWRQRNYELETVTEYVASTKETNRILMGDWNITPYSPFFKKVLNKTELNMASRYYFLEPTWPSAFNIPLFSIFQIPIDHILFSDKLIPVYKDIDESLGSDHHPVIMKFTEQKN